MYTLSINEVTHFNCVVICMKVTSTYCSHLIDPRGVLFASLYSETCL